MTHARLVGNVAKWENSYVVNTASFEFRYGCSVLIIYSVYVRGEM